MSSGENIEIDLYANTTKPFYPKKRSEEGVIEEWTSFLLSQKHGVGNYIDDSGNLILDSSDPEANGNKLIPPSHYQIFLAIEMPFINKKGLKRIVFKVPNTVGPNPQRPLADPSHYADNQFDTD